MKDKIRNIISEFGISRWIIVGFIFVLFCLGPVSGNKISVLATNVVNRFAWNAILVLSMVPMIHSGCGLNFGLPLGIEAGLLGVTLAIELGFTGNEVFFAAITIATPFAIIFGALYGFLLNKIKGGEMMIATYVGFSAVSLMCICWTMLPYTNPVIVWGYTGKGLRTMISIESFFYEVLSSFLRFTIFGVTVPTGAILFFALLALGVWAFLHTKTGTAMTAVGSNPSFAKAAGINVDKIRLISVVLSTWLAAIGIINYEQGFGYVQLYTAPYSMAMPAVAAVLLGGASVNKASISNVIIGTILYQAIVTTTPNVINSLIALDISDVLRTVISNGVILFALTRNNSEKKHLTRNNAERKNK